VDRNASRRKKKVPLKGTGPCGGKDARGGHWWKNILGEEGEYLRDVGGRALNGSGGLGGGT